jgi:uncharacterized protein YjbI with pentapeptide repeats/energy-coupling factor transporter ATP-binding protein EcfA2
VVSRETGHAILLDEEIEYLIEAGKCRMIEIRGGDGSGKTTALEHLAATLIGQEGIAFLDEPEAGEIDAALARGCDTVIYTSHGRCWPAPDTDYALAGWTDDDLIEYLLAAHPSQCASVTRRLQGDDLQPHLRGTPELWRVVLDEMAQDASLGGSRLALRRAVGRVIEHEETWHRAAGFCLAALLGDEEQMAVKYAELSASTGKCEDLKLLRHRAVRLLLGSEELVAALRSTGGSGLRADDSPRDLVGEAGRVVAADDEAARGLRKLVKSVGFSVQPVAASILHAAGVKWRPNRRNACLQGAFLAGVKWRKTRLVRADLRGADLSHADMTETDLRGTDLQGSNLGGAALTGARLQAARFCHADLRAADLSGIEAKSASFHRANLTGANLRQATLVDANFSRANLSGAQFCNADLSGASLVGAKIEDADFTGANFERAVLERLALRTATMTEARCAGARLSRCDLEFMELPGAEFERADLRHAWLTASVMPYANFQAANLQAAGLADVQWEGANLRHADLRGCSFHMGSSRSGLVGSPYPSHGTRTGFYTDAFDERFYKSPEEIRKADLREADLRGAQVADTDFYLVDLRGARYDFDQAQHFRRCDAILEDWT